MTSAIRFGRFLALIAAPALLTGCPEEDTASLEASVKDPSLVLEASALVTDASGGLTLSLHLGSYASNATEVSLGAFTLTRAGDELFGPVPLAASREFPVSVGVGKDVSVTLSLEPGTTATMDEAAALCDGPLTFVGSVSDTLGGNKPIRVESPAFEAQCEL
jgi:hypothetical protein